MIQKKDFLDIINLSLKEGICPSSWKISNVIPIPKKPKTIKVSEFRPINKLPIYEKILELIVKVQLDKFIKENIILTENQSGFRTNYSYETAIQNVIDHWKITMSRRKLVGVIFIDLKRAFEMVNREILINKIRKYGINGVVLKWFKSYTNKRYQILIYKDEWSDAYATEL